MILILFIFLPYCIWSYTSPLSDYFKNKELKEIAFLIRNDCFEPNTDLLLVGKSHVKYTDPKETETCSDTIGFMPINDDVVQLFVTVNTNGGKDMADKDVKLDIESVTLSFQGKKIATCKDDGTVTLTNEHDKLKASDNFEGEVLYLESNTGIIQCKSIQFKHKMSEFEGKWKLTITNKVTGVPEINIEGDLKKKDFDHLIVPCDTNLLKVTGFANDNHRSIELVEKTRGQADILENSKKEPFFKTKIEAKCKVNYTLTYKLKDEEEKELGELECKKISDKYQYSIKPLSGSTEIHIDRDKEIEVKCVKYNCRHCDDLQPSHCPGDAGCDGVNRTNPEEYNKCSYLETTECKSNLFHVNGKFMKFNSAENVECGEDKQWNFTEKLNSFSCAARYSAVLSDPSNITYPNVTETKEARNCFNLTTGCQCLNAEEYDYLAIVSEKEGIKEWRRVNNVRFNSSDNEWIYERSHVGENGAITMNHKLKEGTAVRCLSAVPLPQIQPNVKKTTVIGVNIALIFIFALLSIPGVIVFVNAKEKKREAHKAAKANKKKEDQSGDKKDGEIKDGEKKKEEKKNEA